MTGSGTELDPYVIYNATDLQNMNNNLTAYYILNNDIDLNSISWTEIGNSSTQFTGHFDGKDYTISNLNTFEQYNFSFFGYVSNAEIKNVTCKDFILSRGGVVRIAYGVNMSKVIVENITFNSGNKCGLIGYFYWQDADTNDYLIENCRLSGTFNDSYDLGGIIGYLYEDSETPTGVLTIKNCSASITVNEDIDGAGGLIGHITAYDRTINISDSFTIVNSDLGEHQSFGGIIGYLHRGYNISLNCVHSNVNIYGCYGVGGFIGRLESDVKISNSYVIGTIATDNGSLGDYILGGFLGHIDWTFVFGAMININSCYADVDLTINTNHDGNNLGVMGGFIGFVDEDWDDGNNTINIIDCYATGNVIDNYGDNSGLYGGTGGFVGTVDTYENPDTDIVKFENCYSVGKVTAVGGRPGGFCGYTISYSGPCISSYWDTQTSGQSTSAIGTGKTTAEMKQQTTFVDWDFSTIWNITEDTTYPWLINKCVSIIQRIFNKPGFFVRVQ